jgi:NAD(P)-dependent dehydrogenase (short-subunit alcohol dehydrogenase family)
MITGANSGLGLATTRQFARLGAKVIMVCRDPKKGENAISEIKLKVPNASVELMICDLASMKSVRS